MRHAVDISRCCRGELHSGCTGCDCDCHHIPVPKEGLRALIEREKEREES